MKIARDKKAEELLRENERQYRILFEDSPVSLWEEDFSEVKKYIDRLRAEGVRDFKIHFNEHPEDVRACAALVKVVAVNKATLRMFRAKTSKALEGSLEKIFTEESYDVFKNELIALADDKTVFESEAVNRDMEGNTKHIHMRWAVSPGYEKSLAKVYVSILDITDYKSAEERLRESEERFRNAFDHAAIGRALASIDGRFIRVNRAMCEMTGYTEEELLNKTWMEMTHPDFMKRHLEYIERLLAGDIPSMNMELKANHKEDRDLWIHLTIVLIRNKQGQPLYFFGDIQDITDRKRAEDELKNSRQQLRELAAHLQSAREEERTSIAREIHDELGQMLTALRMDLSWLEGKLSQDQKSQLEKIRSMSKLTDTTLKTVKRISSELRPGLLDDLGLAAAVEWQAEEFKKRTGIKCSLIIEPQEFVLDGERSTTVFRIFQEALTNIVRHAEATEVKVYLRKKADRLLLEVTDNGKGIREHHIASPRSFGLIGMRERCYFLGGDVTIRGQRGKGTTVEACIPLPAERGNK
ncbi:MAG: PAS domain S-box protein [Candidatus Glassbacteria bacterium]